jgi:hypothetical protein
MKSVMKWVRLVIVVGQVAHAQVPEPSAPPLVPTPEPVVPTPAAPPSLATPPAPMSTEPASTEQEDPSRWPRIGMGLLLGAASGAAGGVAGGFIGAATINDGAVQPLGRTLLGAGIGFALLAPVGVLLAGRFMDGDGAWWATMLGDVGGLLVGALAGLLGGAETVPMLFGLARCWATS